MYIYIFVFKHLHELLYYVYIYIPSCLSSMYKNLFLFVYCYLYLFIYLYIYIYLFIFSGYISNDTSFCSHMYTCVPPQERMVGSTELSCAQMQSDASWQSRPMFYPKKRRKRCVFFNMTFKRSLQGLCCCICFGDDEGGDTMTKMQQTFDGTECVF